MKPETDDYLAKARAAPADANKIAAVPLPHIAAREAHVSVFHAAQAYILEQTGKVAKTHSGVHTEFARLARAEPRIGRELVAFLAAAFQFKQRADYAIGPPSRRSRPPRRPPRWPARRASSAPSLDWCP